MVGDSIINGVGAGMPLGLLNSPALVSVAKQGSQTADTIVAENILKMWARRLSTANPEEYAWFINQDCEPQLHQLSLGVSTAGGQLVYMPPGGLSERPYATLMGRPVIPIESCQTLGDKGDIILANLN